MKVRVVLLSILVILIWPVLQGIHTICTSWQGRVLFALGWFGVICKVLRGVGEFVCGPWH